MSAVSQDGAPRNPLRRALNRFPMADASASFPTETAEDSESSDGEGAPAPEGAWAPRLQNFSVVVAFKPGDEESTYEEFTVTNEDLKKTWCQDKLQEHLCKLNFENCIVRKITVTNKSTSADFNGHLKLFDAKDRQLYNSVTCFGAEAAKEMGTPLWGEGSTRLVYMNAKAPTEADIAYSGFDAKVLKEGVTHVEYTVPLETGRGSRGRGSKSRAQANQTFRLAHVPKKLKNYFCYALRGVYEEDFTESQSHSVAGLPHLFCINCEDYEKVLEAYATKKGSVRTHDITNIKLQLATVYDGALPPGPHFFQLNFEVWMANKDCAFEEEGEESEEEEGEEDEDEGSDENA